MLQRGLIGLRHSLVPSRYLLRHGTATGSHSSTSDHQPSVITERELSHGFKLRSNVAVATPSTPLIVLLGWAYGSRRLISKYSDIFLNRGHSNCETLIVTTTLFNTVMNIDVAEKKALAVMDTIRQLTIEDHNRPVILYSFSNGGCALYAMITRQLSRGMEHSDNSIHIAGCIFDSCPIRPSIESLAMVQSIAADAVPPLVRPIVRPLIYLITNIGVRLVLKTNPIVKGFMSLIEESPSRAPELYLYSAMDPYAPVEDIQRVIARRTALGVAVTSKMWPDSRHVDHLRRHTQEYTALVQQLIDDAVSQAQQ